MDHEITNELYERLKSFVQEKENIIYRHFSADSVWIHPKGGKEERVDLNSAKFIIFNNKEDIVDCYESIKIIYKAVEKINDSTYKYDISLIESGVGCHELKIEEYVGKYIRITLREMNTITLYRIRPGLNRLQHLEFNDNEKLITEYKANKTSNDHNEIVGIGFEYQKHHRVNKELERKPLLYDHMKIFPANEDSDDVFDIQLPGKKYGSYPATIKSLKNHKDFYVIGDILQAIFSFQLQKTYNPLLSQIYTEIFESEEKQRASVQLKSLMEYSSKRNWFYNKYGYMLPPSCDKVSVNKLAILGAASKYLKDKQNTIETLYSETITERRFDDHLEKHHAWRLSKNHKEDQESLAIGLITYYLENKSLKNLATPIIINYVQMAVSLNKKIDLSIDSEKIKKEYKTFMYDYFLKYGKDEPIPLISIFKSLRLPKDHFELIDTTLKLAQVNSMLGINKEFKPKKTWVDRHALYLLTYNNKRYLVEVRLNKSDPCKECGFLIDDEIGWYGEFETTVPKEVIEYAQEEVAKASKRFFETKKGRELKEKLIEKAKSDPCPF